MRRWAGDRAAGAVVCTILLTAALGLTAIDQQSSRVAGEAAGSRSSSTARLVTQVSTVLDRDAHPAADPLFGALWSQSHHLIMPVRGVDPGELEDTFTQPRATGRLHEAIDILAPRHAPVVAVTDGVVLRLTEHDSGGISLYLLAPDDRTVFYYAHLAGYAEGVRAGMPVRQGDVLGYVGDTGNAGPGNYHLHFEVMVARSPRQYWVARPRNPYPLLKSARG
ncbi:MAG TPA: M23 family metallopeptidase [Longimicrobiales bacterium]